MKQAIIYARFSPRPNPDVCTSIEFQIDKCKSFCEMKGFDVIADYRDAGISGKSLRDRPGFKDAMRHVCRIKGVLVAYHLTRISRGIIDAVNICEILERNGADLAVVTQSIDTTTAVGRFLFYVMSALGQLEREQISERTSAKMQHMHSQGLRISVHARFGYSISKTDPTKVVPNRDEQRMIKQIVVWRKAGNTLNEICDLLTLNGYEPRGKAWYPAAVGRILNRHLPPIEQGL